MASAEVSRVSSSVRRQYEDFPYPHRDPEKERGRLLATLLDDLGAINLHCYGGLRDFTNGFRALVAGGGTGDATIYLAHQLRQTDATVVHLDMSAAAIDVAQQRAQIRGLQNIEWINASLLDVSPAELGTFDYINCSGVLHHLDDPTAGLRALRRLLKDDGAVGLMLYGQYGRTGIYQLQDLLRRLQTSGANFHERIADAKSLLRSLPHTNWYRRGEGLFGPAADDAELFDRFLHARDRGYTVPQVYELLDEAGLLLAEFGAEFRALYRLNFAAAHPDFARQALRLSARDQQAAAELYWGAITKHSFWATPVAFAKVDLLDTDNVPYFSRLAEVNGIRQSILGWTGPKWSYRVPLVDGIEQTLEFACTPTARRFVELTDGRRSLGEIAALFECDSSDAVETCRHIIGTLLEYDLLLLRHNSVPPLCTL